MANIASNTYLFYGDKAELVKCHDALNKIYEKVGNNISCVDRTVFNITVNYEWIDDIGELHENADSFCMSTHSKWYGNPVYWNNWVKTHYPKLSVAFMCEECSMGIFEKVDPDNKFDDYIWIQGSDIPEEDIVKLPQVLKDAIDNGGVWGTFIKDEVFNSKFQPSDLPDSVTYEDYKNTTYDEIRASNEEFINQWAGIANDIQNAIKICAAECTDNAHDAVESAVEGYHNKWFGTREKCNTRKI